MTEKLLTPNQPLDPLPAGPVPTVPEERPEAFTLRIPKPNWQVTALLLVALIAGFQTFQLARLKDSISAKTVTTAAAPQTASASTSPSAASSDLPSQVGGC